MTLGGSSVSAADSTIPDGSSGVGLRGCNFSGTLRDTSTSSATASASDSASDWTGVSVYAIFLNLTHKNTLFSLNLMLVFVIICE